jgi:hypothetical protein
MDFWSLVPTAGAAVILLLSLLLRSKSPPNAILTFVKRFWKPVWIELVGWLDHEHTVLCSGERRCPSWRDWVLRIGYSRPAPASIALRGSTFGDQ